MEPNETPFHTALREAHEEVALPHHAVTILGTLEPITTFVSNSFITPVVGIVDGIPDLAADPGEVARIMTVPLHELARADTYRNEWWATERGDINIHFFELDDETIWGATGRLLHQLLGAISTS
jgi:8-oxo-dGTP pyrophosphatase MutT (NUDIX family)